MRSTNCVPGRPAYFWACVGEERGVMQVAVYCQSSGAEIVMVEAADWAEAAVQARRALDHVTYEAVRGRAL